MVCRYSSTTKVSPISFRLFGASPLPDEVSMGSPELQQERSKVKVVEAEEATTTTTVWCRVVWMSSILFS